MKPIIFSPLMDGIYAEQKKEDLRAYVMDRLKIFNEEELNVELVIIASVLHLEGEWRD